MDIERTSDLDLVFVIVLFFLGILADPNFKFEIVLSEQSATFFLTKIAIKKPSLSSTGSIRSKHSEPSKTGKPRRGHWGKGVASWKPNDEATGRMDLMTSSFSAWWIEHVLYTILSTAGKVKAWLRAFF